MVYLNKDDLYPVYIDVGTKQLLYPGLICVVMHHRDFDVKCPQLR